MENINEQKIARSKKKKKTKSLLNLKPKRILKSQKLKENMEQFTNYVCRKCLILHQWKTNIFIQAWQANFQKGYGQMWLLCQHFKVRV